MATFISDSPVLGVGLNNTQVSAVLPDGTTTGSPSFSAGTRVLGSDGTLWQFCQMSAAVTANAVVAISTSGTCARASVGDAMAGRQLAFAQTTFAANEWGWVALNGNGGPNNSITVLCSATLTANVALYLSSTGVLATTVVTSATVAGVFLTGASGSATTGVTGVAVIATWPKVMNSVTSGNQGI